MHVRSAVDVGGRPKLAGHIGHVVAHQIHIEGGKQQVGNQQGDEVVAQAQLGADHVPRHQPGSERHGDEEEEGQLVAVLHVGVGQRVGAGGGNGHSGDGAEQGHQNGDQHAVHHAALAVEDQPVGLCGPGRGNKAVAIAGNRGLAAEGYTHGQHHRHHAEQGEQTGEEIHQVVSGIEPVQLFDPLRGGKRTHGRASFLRTARLRGRCA